MALKLRLLLEILRAYVAVRIALRRRPFREVVDSARVARSEPFAALTPARLARTVQRVLAPLPFDTRCLVTSLVLVRLLSRAGHAGALVIEVNPGTVFGAHAFVELEGTPLLPTGGPEFQRLSRF